MNQPDPKALDVALATRKALQPGLTILFGSRARGDHDERSDIDIMLVQDLEPNKEYKNIATSKAEDTAREIYGHAVAVDLVWRTAQEFRKGRKYSNSIETRAAEEGQVMPGNPEDYSAHHHGDEQTEHQLDWSTYDQRLRHAEIHLAGFISNCEAGLDDILIGQQAQNTLEYGMKALLEAHLARYRNVHDIGILLGNVRHNDTVLSEFGLSIPPDVYSEYEGEREYRPRTQPRLSDFPDFQERTVADALLIIDRAKQVRLQRQSGNC